MQNAKKIAIEKELNCHNGTATVTAVWSHLPDSCKKLPRNTIADILNACHKAYTQGTRANQDEINEFMEISFWSIDWSKVLIKDLPKLAE